MEIWAIKSSHFCRQGVYRMLEQTFFCIRPYVFDKREIIKGLITKSGLKIKSSKNLWLTNFDLRVIYGHEDPSDYFNACIHYMTNGFVEAGVIEGKNAIQRLVELAGETHIPSQSRINSLRAMFGRAEPEIFNSFAYYFNPLHRSRTETEAKREIKLYFDKIESRDSVVIISDMIKKLYSDKDLECVYEHHIKLVVEIAVKLCEEQGANKTIVELAAWLHDIASLKNSSKYEHHLEGANDAGVILKILGYDDNIIKNVQHCIKTHRGSNPLKQMTKEAEIVCSADGLANLRCAPLLYFFTFKIRELDFSEGIKKIKRKVESSYAKIANFAKDEAKIDYEIWQKLL